VSLSLILPRPRWRISSQTSKLSSSFTTTVATRRAPLLRIRSSTRPTRTQNTRVAREQQPRSKRPREMPKKPIRKDSNEP